jgi:hypothetical protein
MKQKPETLKIILEELKEQCLKTAELISSYDIKNKTQDEADEMIGELSANVSILTVRSGLIESYLDDEDYNLV